MKKNSSDLPTPFSDISDSAILLEKKRIRKNKEDVSIMNLPEKDSRLSTPTTMVPFPTMRLRSDLKSSLNPKTTPSPLTSGNGLRRPVRKSTPRPQVKLTRENSGSSPTPSSSILDFATSLNKKRKKRERIATSQLKNPKKLSLTLIPTETELLPQKKSEKLLRNSLLHMATNSLKMRRNGSEDNSKKMEEKPTVDSMLLNSTNSPTLSPTTSDSATND